MPAPDLTRLAEYNCMDSAGTKQISDILWEELNSTGYRDLYNFYVELHKPLMYMMTRGILVNQDDLKDVLVEVTSQRDAAQEKLDAMCGHELNVDSPKQCIQYFYLEKGITPYLNPKTKAPTCDDIALQRLAKGTVARKPIPEARLVQEIRGLGKLKSTYLEIEFDKDSRMRCSIKPRGTRFSRLSTGKTAWGTGMNMQNLPAQFKKFLLADPGFLFMEFDKRQAEWVAAAYLFNDANMIQAVESGKDIHVHTASMIFNCEPQLIQADDELIGHMTNPFEIEELRKHHLPEVLALPYFIRNMSLRQCGKKSNHGLDYDERFRTFALINDMLERDAKRVIEGYHSIYPGIRQAYEGIKHKLSKDRTLINPFGRKYRFLGKWGHDLFKQAYSYLPQATVGDILNGFGYSGGILGIYKKQKLREYSCLKKLEQLIQVHDSVLTQYPIADLDDMAEACIVVAQNLKPTMEYEGRSFQIETDLKIGNNWGDMFKVPLSENKETMRRNLEKVIYDNELGSRAGGLDKSVSEIRGELGTTH